MKSISTRGNNRNANLYGRERTMRGIMSQHMAAHAGDCREALRNHRKRDRIEFANANYSYGEFHTITMSLTRTAHAHAAIVCKIPTLTHTHTHNHHISREMEMHPFKMIGSWSMRRAQTIYWEILGELEISGCDCCAAIQPIYIT